MTTPKVAPWPAIPIVKPDEVYAGLSDQAKDYPLFLESIVRQEHNFEKPEALSRLRVLDCSTRMMIGHWCSSMLSELGAEVIQVEPPGGDPMRRNTPFGRREYMFKDKETGEEVGGQFLHEMRNKLSITLNLETEEGRNTLKDLAVHADVIIENDPPGQWDSWGIGYRQLREINPRLIYCWVGQRGQWGPAKDKPGVLDPTAQAACGFVHATGDPKEFGGQPTRSALWMADHVGGTAAAMGILAAVLHRENVSGEGQFVEATAAEAIIRILDYSWAWYSMDGSIRPRYGNWDLAINIYAVNPCKDGYMMVGGGHDRLWYRIWRTVGDEYPAVEEDILGDPHLREVTERLAHDMQVKTYTMLGEWLKDNPRSEAERKLAKQQVASGGVLYVNEVAEYPHFKYRGHVAEYDSPHYGKILYGTTPFLQHKTPGRLKWLGRPTGYDNEDVYRRLLGFTREDFKRLSYAGVVQEESIYLGQRPVVPAHPETLPGPGGTPPTGPQVSPGSQGAPTQVGEGATIQRRANFWISERESDSRVPLKRNGLYTGNFRIGSPVPASLITGDQAKIPDSDVPPDGLQTSWVVAASDIEFESIDATTVANNFSEGGAGSWSIRFGLLIPRIGDSETIQFRLRPLARNASFVAYVYVRSELYREFHVKLLVEDPKSDPGAQDGPPVVTTDDILVTTPGHLSLRATHEWTTPSDVLTVTVSGQNKAAVLGGWGIDDDYFMNTEASYVSGSIMNVRKAADDFRAEYSDYLDDIKPKDLIARLTRRFQPQYDWARIQDFADVKHRRRWNAIATSKELFDFAYHGRQLYDTMFPLGEALRGFLDESPPGRRINIIWRPTSGPPWVPHVPWGLMYCGEVTPGVPVDPTGFWGLRYRLGYSAYPSSSPSYALGSLQDSWCANFLYYGDDLHNPAAKEGKWQKKTLLAWRKQFIVPTGTTPDPRKQITNELSTPTRQPTSVVYIFCQCSVGRGNMPVLQFVSEGDPIRHTELGTGEFAGHPLVFANACVTGASEPQIVNELEKTFFQRKCRAYIGTETRLPIHMAGRFASVFFHFFYRLIDSEPMKAGEAISQARLFLWSHYKNVGGLFYTQINHYDLCMASDAEIKSLRQW